MKIYLTLIGIAYAGLSIWCAIKPAQTAEAVGFQLTPGSGQSEYFTVYGGLQLAMAAIFLSCWYRPDWATPALLACIVIHGCLVLFRTIGFTMFSDIGTTTYALAATEWVILLSGIAVYYFGKSAAAGNGVS